MADPKALQVSLPGAGQTISYSLTAGTPVEFTFDISEAVFTGTNGNLEISIEGGGTVILEGYQALAESGSLPTFITMDGEQIAGEVYLFAFEGTEETAEELETAADAAGGGSGAGEYSDDAGQLGDGINALGGQGDAYGPRALDQLVGVLGNNPPVAVDDEGIALEEGDHDLVPGKYIAFADYAYEPYFPNGNGDYDYEGDGNGSFDPYQEYLHQFLPGWGGEGYIDPDWVTFLPLAGGEGGGILIYNPNPPQDPYIEDGNLLDNDYDIDGDPIVMNSIDYIGENQFGVDEPLVATVTEDTVVVGRYGVLVVQPDGEYVYTLNQEWADELDEGDVFEEIFEYTIVDPLDAVSNTATLTVTVYGSNDMPLAASDSNLTAVEAGDSTGFDLPVYDAPDFEVVPTNNIVDVTPDEDGYGTLMDLSDDGSMELDITSVFASGLNFFGTTYNSIFINSNGNITLGHSNSSFVPVDLADYTGGPLIGAQWDDFDPSDGGEMYYHLDSANGVLTVTWDGVPSWGSVAATDDGSGNTFQIRLHDQGGGDFGMEFRYGDISWAGDWTDPSGGWTSGDGSHWSNVFGSGESEAFVSVEDTSNMGQAGVYTWNVSEGQPGELVVHDYTTAVNAQGNVLLGTVTGGEGELIMDGVDDTDPDASDVPDGQSLFVVGVYSNHTQTVDFGVPGEDGNPPPDYGPSMDPDQLWDIATAPDTTYSVMGRYGILTIEPDGDYTYVLYNEENMGDYLGPRTFIGQDAFYGGEGQIRPGYGVLEELDSLNYDNPGYDYFTYGIMDDSGAFNHASLNFTVNGANDAPVAFSDQNSVIEFGEHYILGGESAESYGAGTATGNLITYDYDVDNSIPEGEVRIFSIKAVQDDGGETVIEAPSLEQASFLAAPVLPDSHEFAASWEPSVPTGGDSISIQGQYGVLTISNDGSYTYELNNDHPEVQALNVIDGVPQTLTDTFEYTTTNRFDDGVFSNPAELSITIQGSNDAPEVFNNTPTAEIIDVVVDHFGAAEGLTEYSTSGMTFTALSDTGDPELDAFMFNSWLGVDHGSWDGPAIDGNWGDDGVRIDFDLPQDNIKIELAEFNWHNYDNDVAKATMYGYDGTVLGTVTLNKYSGTNTFDLEAPPEQMISYVVVETDGSSSSEFFIDSVSAKAAGTPGMDVHAVEAGESHDYMVHFLGDRPDVPDVAVTGNVIDDPSTDPGEMGMIDYDVDNDQLTVINIASENEGTSEALENGVQEIEGEFGTLFIQSDGQYVYSLNEEATDHLNEGDRVVETFTYTVTDAWDHGNVGATSADGVRSAELNITIDGTNDAPIARCDHTHYEFLGVETITFNDWSDAHGQSVFHADGLTISALSTAQLVHLVETGNNDLGVKSGQMGGTDNPMINNAGSDEGIMVEFDLAQAHVVMDLNRFNTGREVNDDARIMVYDMAGNELDSFKIGRRFDSADDELEFSASDYGGTLIGSIVIQTPFGDENDDFLLNWIRADVMQMGDEAQPTEHGEQHYVPDDEGIDVMGNVLLNDFDVDNIDYVETGGLDTELSVVGIRSLNELGNAADEDGGVFVIDGEYGTLTIQANGYYTYVLDQQAVDALDIEDREEPPVERFAYAISDNEPGAELHDAAILSFQIMGTNDAPVALNDGGEGNRINVYEEGGEGQIALLALFDGGERGGEGGGEGGPWIDEDPLDHIARGNVLQNDTDVDDIDISDAAGPGYPYPRDVELTVTAVAAGNLDNQPYDADDFESVSGPLGSPGADVEGTWGTLTIRSGGRYEYVLDPDKTDPLDDGDVRYETFTYRVDDDNGDFDLATLTFRVHGTNDPPVAVDDIFGDWAVATSDFSDAAGLLSWETDGMTFTAMAEGDNPSLNLTYDPNYGLGVRDTAERQPGGDGDHDMDSIDGYGDANSVRIDFEYGGMTDVTITLGDYNDGENKDDGTLFVYGSDGTTLLQTITFGGSAGTDPSFTLSHLNYGGEKIGAVIVHSEKGSDSNNDFWIKSVQASNDTDFYEDQFTDHGTAMQIAVADILANDFDVDALDTLSVVEVFNPSVGTVSFTPGDDFITFEAPQHFNGDVSFQYRVTDGTTTDTATVYFDVDPVNDAPFGVHDGYHEISIISGDESGGDWEISDDADATSQWGQPNSRPTYTYEISDDLSMTLTAGTYNPGGEVNLALQPLGGGEHALGLDYVGKIWGAHDSDSMENLTNRDWNEYLDIEFNQTQTSLTIDFIDLEIHDGWLRDHPEFIKIEFYNGNTLLDVEPDTPFDWTTWGHQDQWVAGDNDGFVTALLSAAGQAFDKVRIIPQTTHLNDGSLIAAIKGSGSPIPPTIDLGSADNGNGGVDGNVLTNDFDIEGDDLDVANIVGDGDTTATPDGFSVEGAHGTLTINAETGAYTYVPHDDWDELDGSVTDVFTYTVTDNEGGTDTASLEFSLNVDNTFLPQSEPTDQLFEMSAQPTDTIVGTEGDDVIFPVDGSEVEIGGEGGGGADSIVIDEAYLGSDGSATVSGFDMGSGDHLDLGNLTGVEVSLSAGGEGNSDLSLVFNDIDSGDEMTIILEGVNPNVNDIPVNPVEIDTSEDLNTLIQSIIDSGNQVT